MLFLALALKRRLQQPTTPAVTRQTKSLQGIDSLCAAVCIFRDSQLFEAGALIEEAARQHRQPIVAY